MNKKANINNILRIYLIIIIQFLFVFNISARINLPQISKTIQISKDDHALLWNYFSQPQDNEKTKTDANVKKVILNYLEETFQASCSEMISYWGSVAEGTATLKLRTVYINDNEYQGKKYVMFAVRCFSSYPEYAQSYCDERLAALMIDARSAFLALLPHADDCKNCPELSRIQFDQIIQKKDPLIIALSIKSTNENPCCDGPYQYKDKKINYYAFLKSGVKQVASLLHYQSEYSHDHIEGDYHRIYQSKINYDINPKQENAVITSKYSIVINGVEKETGVKYYLWNPKKKEFELSDK